MPPQLAVVCVFTCLFETGSQCAVLAGLRLLSHSPLLCVFEQSRHRGEWEKTRILRLNVEIISPFSLSVLCSEKRRLGAGEMSQWL